MTHSVEQVMSLVDKLNNDVSSNNFGEYFIMNLVNLAHDLQTFGPQAEAIYSDQLNRAFINLRKISLSKNLQQLPRKLILFLIEIRAHNWVLTESVARYYRTELQAPWSAPQENAISEAAASIPSQSLPSPPPPAPPILAPGETINTSGKFAKPTKIPGKNYFKDEVVIRNADSGKVMGIKGRRVHMIEELSETVISFQRVNPGAKERLVQITGQDEAHINYARHLMGDTIRRNASPVPFKGDQPDLERVGGSSSSVNSSASDESARAQGYPRARLHHSLSTNDASVGDYKYTVMVGGNSVKITGSNYTLVMKSKLALDKFFENEPQQLDCGEFFTSYDDDYPSTFSIAETLESKPAVPVNVSSAAEQQTAVRQVNAAVVAPTRRLVYSRQQLCQFAYAVVCAQEPDNWDKLCPAAVRKVFVHPADPRAFLVNLVSDFDSLLVRSTSVDSDENQMLRSNLSHRARNPSIARSVSFHLGDMNKSVGGDSADDSFELPKIKSVVVVPEGSKLRSASQKKRSDIFKPPPELASYQRHDFVKNANDDIYEDSFEHPEVRSVVTVPEGSKLLSANQKNRSDIFVPPQDGTQSPLSFSSSGLLDHERALLGMAPSTGSVASSSCSSKSPAFQQPINFKAGEGIFPPSGRSSAYFSLTPSPELFEAGKPKTTIPFRPVLTRKLSRQVSEGSIGADSVPSPTSGGALPLTPDSMASIPLRSPSASEIEDLRHAIQDLHTGFPEFEDDLNNDDIPISVEEALSTPWVLSGSARPPVEKPDSPKPPVQSVPTTTKAFRPKITNPRLQMLFDNNK